MSLAKQAPALTLVRPARGKRFGRGAFAIEAFPRSEEGAGSLGKSALYIESLYNQYRSSLLNYLTGLLPGGRQDADEILHETYIRLLKQDNLDRLEENARAYIFTVATNLVRDLLRKRSSRCVDAHIPFEEGDFASTAPSPASEANWQESLASLKQALQKLNPNTRKIFLLSRFEEMTYPEIASAMDISTRTVERHMAIAFSELQNSLDGLL